MQWCFIVDSSTVEHFTACATRPTALVMPETENCFGKAKNALLDFIPSSRNTFDVLQPMFTVR